MATPRDKHTRELQRSQVADLYLRGFKQVEIAEQLGVNQATVSNDLKVIHNQWRDSAIIDLNELKHRELEKIDQLEREYWKAWEKSTKDTEVITQKAKSSDTGKEVILRREGQAGDPRFLAGVMTCIERRCKLLGIDAPEKREISGKDGKPLAIAIVKMDTADL